MLLFFEAAQTHNGLDDANFTCWLLKLFLEALIRRRDGKNTEMRKLYELPSEEWDRDGAGPRKRRRRQAFPGPGWKEAAAAAQPRPSAPASP